mmetsp:Transcript_28216/g.65548  ORF Transcript_28216/g.65548 Transcript_28216/m.65548 type:complete len:143 (+) Transcript_28216:399-827(+)
MLTSKMAKRPLHCSKLAVGGRPADPPSSTDMIQPSCMRKVPSITSTKTVTTTLTVSITTARCLVSITARRCLVNPPSTRSLKVTQPCRRSTGHMMVILKCLRSMAGMAGMAGMTLSIRMTLHFRMKTGRRLSMEEIRMIRRR